MQVPASTTRVTREQAVAWLGTLDIAGLGLEADAARRARHGRRTFYRVPRHVTLAASGVQGQADRARDVRVESVDPRIELEHLCGIIQHLASETEGLLEGLLAEDLQRLGAESPQRLRRAGLYRVLGSHVETFEGGRRMVRGTLDWDDSLEVLEGAARAGLRVYAALPYGNGETAPVLAARLFDLRDLQDRHGALDGVALVPTHPVKEVESPGEITFGYDDSRLMATTRLVLDNVAHLQVPWLEFGFKAGQMALLFGADDLGPWCLDAAVTADAGLSTYLAIREAELYAAIAAAGLDPVRLEGREDETR